MANIKPAEISAIIKNQLTGSKVGPSLDEVGTVLQVGDGIARVYGLSNVQYGELVQFDNGMEGIVLNLEEYNVGVVLLGPSKEIKEDNNLIEKVSFNIWWEDKYNDSVIVLRTYPENIKTIQVGNGMSINKNQVLEIYKEVDNGSIFSSNSYIFNIVYKDENSKVSTGKIIFSNKRASKRFEKVLVDFGF